MSVIAIDTHEMVKELTAAGFSDKQAETVTRMLRQARDLDISQLAAKSDLREAELRLETKVETTKAEIIKWMFGTIGFQTLIILGAVIALARLLQP